ncbi:hypothetical protein ILYODFUR_022872 [Ilyodon furcidens]|uniref:Uncharacterized protein n=1 Tax=Ilyodon furcidens TaxID=33524 RepID=A0ABV0TBH8_9TELE
MGSVSECMTSIVVCLYVGCVGVSVFMCMYEGVPVFCVRLGVGLLPLLDQFRPPIKCGAYFLPAHYLLVVGVSARRCTCGSQCPGLGALVCAGSLPVAACWGLDPWALSGLCLGSDVSRGLDSLGPWLDVLGRRRLPAGPVGSSLQFPWASALWPLGFSPAVLWGVAVVPAVVLLGFLSYGGAFGCLWLGSSRYLSRVQGGQVCGSSHSLLHIFMEKPCIHKRAYIQTHRCLDSGVNRYTNVLY